jgi:solute carrier family 25 phosphate transporter 23/24/25/41
MRLSVAQALRHIVRQEGFRALWKGNGVTIIHRLPYSAANFWTYETVNEYWKQHIPARGPLAVGDVSRRLVAGGVAGMAACTLAYPLDLVRTRLAAQTARRYYRGIGHALATIVRDEGAAGLYRGLGATLAQVAPSLAINYAAYETARSAWLARTERTAPTVPMSLACGSAAGLVSSTATFPLDLVRRRLQIQGQGGTARVYASYAQAFRTIVEREGARGLYAGILPEYYKVVPGVAIAFCTYELMKRTLHVRTNSGAR